MRSPKLSLLKNLGISLLNLRKERKKFQLESLPPIEINAALSYSPQELKRFNQMVNWRGEQIPPTFPYALLTHLHFELVNHRNFPFSPYGLIHKREEIEVSSPLKAGAWHMRCRIDRFRKVERGYEMDLISELTIDGKVCWKSITTAFKKTEAGLSLKKHEAIQVESDTRWNIPGHQGLAYGLVSNNIDPIHISAPTAKMMGHKRAIIHGMWSVARGLSEWGDLNYPLRISIKFISPVYIPTEVLYVKDEKGFGVYSGDGKRVHLQAEVCVT